MSDHVDQLITNLEQSLARARAERLAEFGAPEGWEHVGWIDVYGQLWGLRLRNGALSADRPVFAPPKRSPDPAATDETEGQ